MTPTLLHPPWFFSSAISYPTLRYPTLPFTLLLHFLLTPYPPTPYPDPLPFLIIVAFDGVGGRRFAVNKESKLLRVQRSPRYREMVTEEISYVCYTKWIQGMNLKYGEILHLG